MLVRSKVKWKKVLIQIDLVFNVAVDANWYVYSSDLAPGASPIPATVAFEESDGFEIIGGLIPTSPKKKFDNFFKDFRDQGKN